MVKGQELRSYVGKVAEKITREYDELKQSLDDAIDSGSKEVEEFLNSMSDELTKKTGSCLAIPRRKWLARSSASSR